MQEFRIIRLKPVRQHLVEKYVLYAFIDTKRNKTTRILSEAELLEIGVVLNV
jgi:hypothetical protein